MITTLFTDIGGVLLTNGWDRGARRRAAEAFSLEVAEMDERHHLTFGTYEAGKLDLEEYLSRVVFYRERPFSRQQFREFMFAQSRPYPQMLELVGRLKVRHRLKVVAVSNEGREIMAHRIDAFGLRALVDVFVVSCFVHFRKPDADIYRLAVDVAQVAPQEVVYLEDREMFATVARSFGLQAIQHKDYPSTCAALEALGLGSGLAS